MTIHTSRYDDPNLFPLRNIECCRRNRLVYARTLKCGSEFFWNNLVVEQGWQPIKWENIDWHHDHVFSYVMDPIKRRHKGIAEWLVINHMRDHFFSDQHFRTVINACPSLDQHSASLASIYADRFDHIDWIPMFEDHSIAIGITDIMFQRHELAAVTWLSGRNHIDYVHSGRTYMEDLYQEIKSMWDASFVSESHHYYFQRDFDLWRRACIKYNQPW
jgi:hypothetical protein